MGITFGNSVFSETYAVMGLVGIVLIAIVHSCFFKLLFELRHKSNQIVLIWITHYFIAIPLLKAFSLIAIKAVGSVGTKLIAATPCNIRLFINAVCSSAVPFSPAV